jgi:hypothetical protein
MTKTQNLEVELIRSATIAVRRLKRVFEDQEIYVSNVPLFQLPRSSNWSQLKSVQFTFLRNSPHPPQIASQTVDDGDSGDGTAGAQMKEQAGRKEDEKLEQGR